MIVIFRTENNRILYRLGRNREGGIKKKQLDKIKIVDDTIQDAGNGNYVIRTPLGYLKLDKKNKTETLEDKPLACYFHKNNNSIIFENGIMRLSFNKINSNEPLYYNIFSPDHPQKFETFIRSEESGVAKIILSGREYRARQYDSMILTEGKVEGIYSYDVDGIISCYSIGSLKIMISDTILLTINIYESREYSPGYINGVIDNGVVEFGDTSRDIAIVTQVSIKLTLNDDKMRVDMLALSHSGELRYITFIIEDNMTIESRLVAGKYKSISRRCRGLFYGVDTSRINHTSLVEIVCVDGKVTYMNNLISTCDDIILPR